MFYTYYLVNKFKVSLPEPAQKGRLRLRNPDCRWDNFQNFFSSVLTLILPGFLLYTTLVLQHLPYNGSLGVRYNELSCRPIRTGVQNKEFIYSWYFWVLSIKQPLRYFTGINRLQENIFILDTDKKKHNKSLFSDLQILFLSCAEPFCRFVTCNLCQTIRIIDFKTRVFSSTEILGTGAMG